jgi:uncharacterized protein (TIRG00374 family)
VTKHVPLIAFGLKVAITLGLLGYLLRKVDVAPVLTQIRAIAPVAAIVGALILLAQLVLLGLRWQLVNRIVDAPMQGWQVLRLTMIGHFFNQVLPSGLAGDAVRAWLASRQGVQLGRLVRGIVCDRIVGLVVLVIIIGVTFVVSPHLAADKLPATHVFRTIAVLGLSALAALFLWGEQVAGLLIRYRLTEPLGKLTRDLHRVHYSRGTSAAILGLAAAVHLLNVAVIYVCARGMHIELDFGAALIVIPAVMLVSMAPISFAGWGVREGAMIFGLGLLGISAAAALAVSVAFGILQFLLGLPGAALWLALRGTARADAATPQSPG